jgi:transketolase C-terminal domain/subunit
MRKLDKHTKKLPVGSYLNCISVHLSAQKGKEFTRLGRLQLFSLKDKRCKEFEVGKELFNSGNAGSLT